MDSFFRLEVDADELIEFAARFKEAPKAIDAIMGETMWKSVAVIDGAVRPETPVNLGVTRAAWQMEVKGHGPNLVGRVFLPVPWGMALEVGRKPGRMPPIDAIQMWVKRKRQISDDKEARQVAFLIARAIGKRGTPGAHMAEKGMEKARPIVLNLWRDAAGRILEAIT